MEKGFRDRVEVRHKTDIGTGFEEKRSAFLFLCTVFPFAAGLSRAAEKTEKHEL